MDTTERKISLPYVYATLKIRKSVLLQEKKKVSIRQITCHQTLQLVKKEDCIAVVHSAVNNMGIPTRIFGNFVRLDWKLLRVEELHGDREPVNNE